MKQSEGGIEFIKLIRGAKNSWASIWLFCESSFFAGHINKQFKTTRDYPTPGNPVLDLIDTAEIEIIWLNKKVSILFKSLKNKHKST